MMNVLFNKKGFTIIEILVVVAIIGIIVSIALAMWAIGAQKKAAINAYKTSMESAKTAVEMCFMGGGIVSSNVSPGGKICSIGNEYYPTFSSKCGNISQFIVSGTAFNWVLTTNEGCQGCRFECSTSGCNGVGNCF